MEKKTSAFAQIPMWLVDELTTVKELKAYLKMYNGWCLMKDKDADDWYYRSISKLKEDFGMNPTCSDTRVTKIIKRFEELGILLTKSEGKKTNWYKFDEEVLFNHIEEETSVQDVPMGWVQDVPKQIEGDGYKLYPIYNTRKNMNDIIHECSITCTGEDNSKNQHNMKIDERLITENEKDAWEILSMDDDFDCSQYEAIARMVQSDTGNKGVKNELSDFDTMNKWCSWAYNELEQLIQLLYKSWNRGNVLSYADKINSLFDEVDEHISQGWFTDKQICKFDGMVNNFNAIIRKKAELMDGAGNEQSAAFNATA